MPPSPGPPRPPAPGPPSFVGPPEAKGRVAGCSSGSDRLDGDITRGLIVELIQHQADGGKVNHVTH